MYKKIICGITATAVGILACGCNSSEKSANNEINTTVVTEKSTEQTETTEKNIQTEASTEKLAETTEAVTKKKEEAQVSENTIEAFKNELYVLGDSIAYGYGSYGRLPAAHVLAEQGVNLSTALETTFLYEYGEGYAVNIISEVKPKYLMLSMGMNEIGNRKYERFAEKYIGIVDEIQEASPETIILVAGLTPVCLSAENKNIDNENIEKHNKTIEKSFSGRENVYYVNPGEALKGNDGAMNPDYSGGDGIHLSGAAYDAMLEELAKAVVG